MKRTISDFVPPSDIIDIDRVTVNQIIIMVFTKISKPTIGILIPDKHYPSGTLANRAKYHTRTLDDTFGRGNGWGVNSALKSLIEWKEFFTLGKPEFIAFDTMLEALEFSVDFYKKVS